MDSQRQSLILTSKLEPISLQTTKSPPSILLHYTPTRINGLNSFSFQYFFYFFFTKQNDSVVDNRGGQKFQTIKPRSILEPNLWLDALSVKYYLRSYL